MPYKFTNKNINGIEIIKDIKLEIKIKFVNPLDFSILPYMKILDKRSRAAT